MKNKEGMRKMKSKAITKLASQTETMYAAIMAKIKVTLTRIGNENLKPTESLKATSFCS